ncbi:MAG: alanine--tRNA ligase [Fimbriimonadaceae bacterium]|nr:alanine--tRNA ligase [Fimbriimonadaceae bacterium]
MTASELRRKYLEFFQSKGHTLYPSGSLIPFDVTGRLDESLLFNGAGMVQFKPFFRGVAEPPSRRLTNVQKCVRTGDIEEVGNLSHLTFFEMLGNFSFGDYFKEEAIAYSWEFLTSPQWLGLDPKRLSFTVFEEDDEAYDCWAKHVSSVGIDPETRVFRLGEETNYWPAGAFSKGPPGPCGPNSEMFYWTSTDVPVPGISAGDYSREQWLHDDEVKNWLEIWNDVFIQFEWQGQLRNPERPSDGFEKSGMPNLPFKSVDTGMGLERTATVLAGLKSVYDTDVFAPIIRKIEEIGGSGEAGGHPHPEPLPRQGGGDLAASGEGDASLQPGDDRHPHPVRSAHSLPPQGGGDSTPTPQSPPPTPSSHGEGNSYPTPNPFPTTASLGQGGGYRYGTDPDKDRATRIICDHIRTACFCIADGILPGNTGRGYVLRRLIRRAVLKGQRALGFEQPFFHLVYEGVVEAMGDHYGQLTERRDVIVETLKSEEALFRRSLNLGLEVFIEHLREVARSQEFEISPATYLIATGSEEVEIDHMSLEKETSYVRRLSTVQDFKTYFEERHLDQRLEAMAPPVPILRGESAFQLYDTYGFPLEVTQELCEEAGVSVDIEGYERALKEAQERSRGASGMDSVYGGVEITFQVLIQTDDGNATPTVFRGYEETAVRAKIVGAIAVVEGAGGEAGDHPHPEPLPRQGGGDPVASGEGDAGQGADNPTPNPLPTTTSSREGGGSEETPTPQSPPPTPSSHGEGSMLIAIALDQTPFYAESGGQVSDEGTIDAGKYQFRVIDVTKQDGVWVHLTEPVNFEDDLGADMDEINASVQKLLFGLDAQARVDESRRRAIIRNHTATHLLHAALREVLGKHVTQAGSYVGPDRLRFDFTHGKALTPDELSTVERMVNEKALLASEVVIHNDVPIDIARSMGAMALFGEKYGDHVRVVEVPGYSIELCGGIHVRNTAEVGMFKILHEASAASGVRRIEAVTGEGAYDWAKHQEFILREAATLLKSNPHDLINAVQKSIDQLREERKRSERMRTQSADASQGQTVMLGEVELASQTLTDGDVKDANLIVDKLIDGHPNRVALVGLSAEGKVTFVCKVGEEAKAKGAHAGNLVKALAAIVGGGGGGRPDFATAGGRDPGKLLEAMAEAQKVVAGMVGG